MKVINVNPENCTGCRLCEFACSVRSYGQSNPSRARIYVVVGEADGRLACVPVLCQQCVDPLCMRLCPAQALHRHPDTNAVVVDANLCLGCRTCVEVCPFGAPSVDPRLGICQKCTLCDGDPACVRICPNEALVFVSEEEAGQQRKRSGVERYLNYLKALDSAPG